MPRPVRMTAHVTLDGDPPPGARSFALSGSFGLVLDDGGTVDTGPHFGFGGGAGIAARHGFWDVASEEDFEAIDAVYRTRREDVEAVLEEWRSEPVWEDGTSAAVRDLMDALRHEGIAATADELLALPFAITIDPAVEARLWDGTHPALDRMTPIPPGDPRINTGGAIVSIPIHEDR